MGDDQPQLVTERLRGGGISARLVAVAATGLLLAVVWLGVAGRSATPVATPPPAAAVSPLPGAAATPPPSSPTPAALRTSAPTPAAAVEQPIDSVPRAIPRRFGPLGEDAFAVTFWLEGRFYMNVLREQESGQLKAVTRVPLYAEMGNISVQIIQLWTRDDRPPLAEIADYELPLGELLTGPRPGVLLDVDREARPRRKQAPRLIRTGYALTVGADVRRDHAYLQFDLTIGGPQHGERRLPGRAPYDDAVMGQRGTQPPLIVLVAQPGTPRGTEVLGHSWVAGY